MLCLCSPHKNPAPLSWWICTAEVETGCRKSFPWYPFAPYNNRKPHSISFNNARASRRKLLFRHFRCSAQQKHNNLSKLATVSHYIYTFGELVVQMELSSFCGVFVWGEVILFCFGRLAVAVRFYFLHGFLWRVNDKFNYICTTFWEQNVWCGHHA